MTARVRYAYADWRAEVERRFGPDPAGWRFACASCGNVATPADWTAKGYKGHRAAHECIGRAGTDAEVRERSANGECIWAAFGLIALGNLVEVVTENGATLTFPFADEPAPAVTA